MDNSLRTGPHKRSNALEALLEKVNGLLEAPELDAVSNLVQPKMPAVFIVGNPRSGTTLLYQWLAASGLFAYPSNIMSRFYNAPYVGGLIHKIFVDHDKHGELFRNSRTDFVSRLGKTRGADAPHEFWYFWRRFFKFGKIQQLSEAALSKVDRELFLKELAAIEYCFGKPLLLKALIMNWNMAYLNQLLHKPLFLFIKRNEMHNMASLYKARILFFNDPGRWYSFKPPEYETLKGKNVYAQLAGQVHYTNQHIERTLLGIQPERSIVLSYEKLCEAPEELYDLILSRLQRYGYGALRPYDGPSAFRPSLNFMDEFDFGKAEEALSGIKSISGKIRQTLKRRAF